MSHCVFDEDIFERLTLLSLTCHLSHTRGISLFSDDDDDVLAELSKSADEAHSGGVKRSACPPIKSDTDLSLQEQCSDNHINESTNNKLDLSA